MSIKANAVRNAKSWEVEYAQIGVNNTPGQFIRLGGLTNSRALIIADLTPGTTYAVRIRTVGTAGYSDWSDPVSHMCI